MQQGTFLTGSRMPLLAILGLLVANANAFPLLNQKVALSIFFLLNKHHHNHHYPHFQQHCNHHQPGDQPPMDRPLRPQFWLRSANSLSLLLCAHSRAFEVIFWIDILSFIFNTFSFDISYSLFYILNATQRYNISRSTNSLSLYSSALTPALLKYHFEKTSYILFWISYILSF